MKQFFLRLAKDILGIGVIYALFALIAGGFNGFDWHWVIRLLCSLVIILYSMRP